MSIANEFFNHSMMIRPGVAKMLQDIAPYAEIFAVTWADIYYARQAVDKANKLGWKS